MFQNSLIQPQIIHKGLLYLMIQMNYISQLRIVTQHTTIDQSQVNTSTLSTLDTTVTQQFQTQQPSPRNYVPSPLPPQNSTQTTPHNSPQQVSSNTNDIKTFQVHSDTHFQTTTQTRQPILQTLSYTPAQTTQTQNIQTGLTINTLHSNTLSNHITSRSLSRPPLQTIPNKQLSYNLTSTNPNNKQHYSTVHNQQNNVHPFSTSHPFIISQNMTRNTRSQTSHRAHTNIGTNPHINTTYTQPFTNTRTIQPNPSNTPTYNTVPPSTIP